MIHASRMGRIANCHGSYKLEQLAPKRPTSEAAKLGTAAAKLAELCLSNGTHPLQYEGQEVCGEIADVEMATHIEGYVNYCRSIPGVMVVENLMRHKDGNLSGAPDCLVFDISTGTLTIIDLKYGFGWVEVEENWQLLSYLTLWGDLYRTDPKRIKLVIYQPRANHPDGIKREWEFEGSLIRNYSNLVMDHVASALLDAPKCKAGRHCRNCSAILGCKTNAATVSECMGFSAMATYSEMTPELLTSELDTLKYCLDMISYRYNAAEEYAGSMIQNGTPVPGYIYDSSVGPLAWSGDAIAQGDMMTVDLRQPEKPITPKQAIDRKILPEKTVRMLARREMKAPKLRKVNLTKFRRMIQNANNATTTP